MTKRKYNTKKKTLNEADDEMEPAYNKNSERQYNKQVFTAAEANDDSLNPDNIEAFDETKSPASDFEQIGQKTKSEQELSMKALDLSLDVVKLLANYDVNTVFKVAALIQR